MAMHTTRLFVFCLLLSSGCKHSSNSDWDIFLSNSTDQSCFKLKESKILDPSTKEDWLISEKFSLFNDSGKAKTLKVVRTSCGCAKAKLDKTHLIPDEIATVELSINPDYGFSQRTEACTVSVDDNEMIELGVKCDWRPALSTDPPQIKFSANWSRGEPPPEIHFRIIGCSPSDMRTPTISAKDSSEWSFRVGPVETFEQRGVINHSCNCTASLNSALDFDNFSESQVQAKICFGPYEIEREFLILAETSVVPSTRSLLLRRGGKPVSKKITLRSKQQFSISSLEIDSDQLAARELSSESSDSNERIVEIMYTPTESDKVSEDAILIVSTDVDKGRKLKISIRFFDVFVRDEVEN